MTKEKIIGKGLPPLNATESGHEGMKQGLDRNV